MSKMSWITFCFLIVIIATCASGQQLPRRVLYGLPPLPEDEEEIRSRVRTTTTVKPLVQRVFPHVFTFPPATLPPILPYTVNPVPELPPMPESRINGYFNDDGDFISNKPEEKQVNENRIHGVKIESGALHQFPIPPPAQRTAFNDDPPRAYSKAKGIELVTVAPSQLARNHHHLISNEESNPGKGTTPKVPPKSRGPQNPRQWQTTATKISSNQMRLHEGLFDGSIEHIDRVSEDPKTPVNRNKTPRPKTIQTTALPVGPIGRQQNHDFTSPVPPVARIAKKGRKPSVLNRTVTPGRRVVTPATHQRHLDDRNPNFVQLKRTQNFVYKPKQRTFQPEKFEQVTKAPQTRTRYLPNPPKTQQIFYNPKPVPSNAHPLPQLVQIQTTLPPQPFNRAPEDAAFLAEIEEYDWRLHYKQNAFENSPPRANPLNGFNRAHASPQFGAISQNNDYEDFEAIKNREHFTDNPPQKSFVLPAGVATSTPPNEVLVAFNNARNTLTSGNSNVGGQAPTAHSIGTAPVRQVPSSNVGTNYQAPTGYQAVTPHPLFGGLFNLFNLHGQNNGGFFLPGFGR